MSRRIMDEFLVRALLAGVGVALVAGPLGSFMVWRRQAYFGDTLAHSALLGVALGFLGGIDPTLGIMATCSAVAVLLTVLGRQRALASDTLLGIMAHGSLALGIVVLAFLSTLRVDLLAYLFGDMLAVDNVDLAWIFGGGAVALAALALIWRPLLSITVHEELARVEGTPVLPVQLAQMVLIALVIAVAMKIVGVLLITALMIIPPATARRFVATPEGMAALAALVGVLAVAGGLAGSYVWDTPSGPTVVVCATLLFALASLWPERRFSRPR